MGFPSEVVHSSCFLPLSFGIQVIVLTLTCLQVISRICGADYHQRGILSRDGVQQHQFRGVRRSVVGHPDFSGNCDERVIWSDPLGDASGAVLGHLGDFDR